MDITWRIQQSGLTKDGKPWAMVLAYVDARAVMDRLDEVCEVDKWRDQYIHIPSGDDTGVMCGLSIRIGDEWITKWDGSPETKIDAFKGGISKALVRCAVKWGVGRYLYDLKATWAVFADNGIYRDKIEGNFYHWNPPALPDWVLPDAEKSGNARKLAKPSTSQSKPAGGKPEGLPPPVPAETDMSNRLYRYEAFEKAKEALGDEVYYIVLSEFGVEHKSDIDTSDRDKVLKALRDKYKEIQEADK